MRTKNERELQLSNQAYLVRLQKLFETDRKQFLEIVEYLPFLVAIRPTSNFDWDFCSNNIENLFEVEKGVIMEEGWDYLKTLVHPSNLAYQMPLLKTFQESKSDKTLTYYQYCKTALKDDFFWIMTHKRIMSDDSYLSVYLKAQDLLNSNDFFNKYLDNTWMSDAAIHRFNSLSKREKEIFQLFAEGIKHQEIADQLFISLHTVRTHWRNIKKKLDIKSFRDVTLYSNSFCY